LNNTIIIDYGMGNLNSVLKKINKISGNVLITSSPEELQQASKIILPGVGHFSKAVNNIKQLGLWEVLNEMVFVKKTPILGICLGMQLMAKSSEEGNVDGFGWFDAEVIKFKVSDKIKFKVPHMGWNTIEVKKQSKLTENLPLSPEFYFVHSYHIKSYNDSEVLANTIYDYEFASALEKDNIFGVQFHPEKSHDIGEKLLTNFLNL